MGGVMPVIAFDSESDLKGELQAALISSVNAVTNTGVQLVPPTSNADDKLAAICWTYAAACSQAESLWWLTEDIPLWWTEAVMLDQETVERAERWVEDRNETDKMVCVFYELQNGTAAARVIFLTEDKQDSALFRTLFDH